MHQNHQYCSCQLREQKEREKMLPSMDARLQRLHPGFGVAAPLACPSVGTILVQRSRSLHRGRVTGTLRLPLRIEGCHCTESSPFYSNRLVLPFPVWGFNTLAPPRSLLPRACPIATWAPVPAATEWSVSLLVNPCHFIQSLQSTTPFLSFPLPFTVSGLELAAKSASPSAPVFHTTVSRQVMEPLMQHNESSSHLRHNTTACSECKLMGVLPAQNPSNSARRHPSPFLLEQLSWILLTAHPNPTCSAAYPLLSGTWMEPEEMALALPTPSTPHPQP